MSLQKYLNEMKILQEKIQLILNEDKQIYVNNSYYLIENLPDDKKDHYKGLLNYKLRYYLITLTFDPKVVINLDQYGQYSRLNLCLNYFHKNTYYACLEKHKSGILHAHILTDIDYHSFQPTLNNIKKLLTKNLKLEPSINCKVVRQNKDDIDRSFDYIFDNKNDHPFYKYIKINI